MSYRVNFTFAILSFLGFVLSLIVHTSTFLGFDPQAEIPPVWLLHIGLFATFFVALWNRKKGLEQKFKSFSDLFPRAPRWMILTNVFFFVYTGINFAIFIYLMSDGSPEALDDGTFALQDHGRFIRTINEAEFHRYQAYEVRGFSGHWMFFYIASGTMLLSTLREQQDAQLSEPDDDK